MGPMTKKLLVARLGAGSITVALCAALPGCNLAITPRDPCVGHPGSRGQSFVVCGSDAAGTDQTGDTPADQATSGSDGTGPTDTTKDQGTGDGI